VRLSAALASDRPHRVRAALREASRGAASGEPPAEAVVEAILQSYLFLGFPVVLAGMREWREIHGGEPGSAAVEPDPLAEPRRLSDWRRRGEEVCRRVYGKSYGKLRQNVRGLHPALDRWMVEEGYGKVLGRPGLDLATRELCIVAVLAVGVRMPQLRSHLKGALNAGAAPRAVREAIRCAEPHLDGEEWERISALAERALDG